MLDELQRLAAMLAAGKPDVTPSDLVSRYMHAHPQADVELVRYAVRDLWRRAAA